MAIVYTLRKINIENIPERTQISNFQSYLKKKTIGKTQISYSELEDWCKSRPDIPNNQREPFV